MQFTMVLVDIRSANPAYTGYYHEGVASLAAVTKKAGHNFTLIHATRPVSARVLARRVAKTYPDVVGFSSTTHSFIHVKRFAPAVKQLLPTTLNIVGGVHAILSPEECMAVEGVDAVCLGEGEGVAEQLMKRLEAGASIYDLSGLWVRDGSTIHRNQVAPLIEDLNSLPPPDRSIFDIKNLTSSREGVMYAFASRGCPYSCYYCCNKTFRSKYPNSSKYVRYKSVSRVCDELESALLVFPGRLRGVFFQDEILPLDREWFAEFVETYPMRVGVPFSCNIRADLVTPEIAQRLRLAGCASVAMGVESGVEQIRFALLGKQISNTDFEDAFQILTDEGIHVSAFVMVGLPNETCEDALTTVRFVSNPKISRHLTSIFCPYPGTVIHERCQAAGILTDRISDTFRGSTWLNQTSISSAQVSFIHDYFWLLTVLLRRFGLNSIIGTAVVRFIKRSDILLLLLSKLFRLIRNVLAIPYLYFGKYVVNRQARVFGKSAT